MWNRLFGMERRRKTRKKRLNIYDVEATNAENISDMYYFMNEISLCIVRLYASVWHKTNKFVCKIMRFSFDI